jgi:uncharacterized protein (DUF885 family)
VRCPDCELERRRLARIARSRPPVATFDGRVQQWRDGKEDDDADAPTRRGLNLERRPTSVAEAQTMVAYNEQILASSRSPQRRDRAARMLANVRPVLAHLEAAAAAIKDGSTRTPARTDDDEFEVVFSGRDSLSKFRQE